MNIGQIARIAHEANRGLCEATGDFSQKSWEEAADWQRESAIEGVQFVIDNPDADAGAQHTAWMNAKIAQGWNYGAVKDGELKTHPSLVPLNELPYTEQAKDELFRAVVGLLVPYLGQEQNETLAQTA